MMLYIKSLITEVHKWNYTYLHLTYRKTTKLSNKCLMSTKSAHIL